MKVQASNPLLVFFRASAVKTGERGALLTEPVIKTLVLLMLLFINVINQVSARSDIPVNIIIFIGDGMGLSQVSAARIINGGLNLDRFPISGMQTTFSSNKLVTDSAASGTALSTGFKTNNGVVSQGPDGKALKTLFEYAKDKNMLTGIVVTSSVTHATPAVFVAHTDSRKNQPDIARQITEGDTDVILGGGLGYFLPHKHSDSYRYGSRDLLAELKQRMPVVLKPDEFNAIGDVSRLAGLFARKHLPKVSQDRQPSLASMTRKALRILSKNRDGFVLMVEGSQIDWGGHQNNQNYMLSELVDFDKAIGIALEFYRNNPDTLILVTADHETGGYAIEDGLVAEKKITDSSFATKHHTATMVPVFAIGKGSKVFSGIMDNTDIGRKLIEYIQK